MVADGIGNCGDCGMSFDPGNFDSGGAVAHQVWNRLFTNLVFDSFVKGIVREHYHGSPSHVTLHITRTESALYIRAEAGASLLIEDDELRDWALEFIAGEVFSVNPQDVDAIYLDGAVGAQDAYLQIAGKGIYIASGDPKRTGRYL
jgi:hypothetical protein